MDRRMDSWNDERLDELNRRVENGFAKVDQEMKAGFARVDNEMKAGFARVDEQFEKVAPREETYDAIGEVKVELRRLNERFDRLLHALLLIAWGVAGTVLAAVIGLLVALV